MLVGIAPGREEDKLRLPFVGKNGKLLDSLLKSCGWDREKCVLTNLICSDIPKAPSIEDTIPCMSRFDSEVKQYQPRLIITFGEITCQAILKDAPRSKVSLIRGIPIWHDKYNCYVMACYQPVAMFNDVNVLYDLVRDLKKIPDILTWKTHGRQADITYTVITDHGRAQEVLDNIPSTSLCTVDIECNPTILDPDIFTNTMQCLAICYDGEHAYVFPYEILPGLQFPLDRNIRWGYQQGQYDIQGILRYLNVQLSLDEDSLLCSYALDERTPRSTGKYTGIHGLKPQSREFLGAGFYEDEVQESWKTGVFDYDVLYEYNARDAVNTWKLINKWLPELKKDGVEDLYYNLLLPAARMFTRLQYRGIGFDPNAAHEVLEELADREYELDESIQEQAADAGYPGYINLNSPKQLARLLYDFLSIEHPGAPSTAAAILEEIDHPIVDQILARRTTEHMKDVYVLGPIKELKSDLRLHPDTLINGTVSGRLAYKNPPIGTLPKAGVNEEFLVVRKLFCARPGYVLVEADYSQAEMRIAAFLCGDPALQNDLSQPVSVHLLTAARILDKEPSQVTEYEKVYTGKKVNFGILYGIGPKALSNRRTGMRSSVQEAYEALQKWHKNYSHYAPWTRELLKYVRKHGEVQTVTGRKRRVPAILNDKQERQIINFSIQSPAGDYTLTSMIELEIALEEYDSWPLFINHDSITFEVREDHLFRCLERIREVMQRPRFPGWPSLPVEIKVGRNMYDMRPESGGK